MNVDVAIVAGFFDVLETAVVVHIHTVVSVGRGNSATDCVVDGNADAGKSSAVLVEIVFVALLMTVERYYLMKNLTWASNIVNCYSAVDIFLANLHCSQVDYRPVTR